MAGRIKGITVEIGGDTTGLDKALQSVNKQIKSTQSQLKDVEKLLKLDPGNTELLAQKHKLLGDAVAETKEKLATLKTAAEQANEALARGDISQEQYDALQREIVETENALKDLEQQAEQSATAVQKIAASGEKLKTLGNNITDVGNKFMPVTAAVAGLGTVAVKTAADFDTAMSKVAAISGATGDDFDALRDKAREMGAKTKFSASEAASAMEYMAMAGWKTGDMLDGIEGIMMLAAASGEDLATTSDIVTDALTAFGLTAADSAHFADILAAASSNANTNVSMMGETFKYCAPVAGALGYSAEDVAAAIGLMANSGIKGSQAGTALRTMMTKLQGELTLTGSAFGEVTIQTANADGSMRELSDILADLRVYFGQMTESEAAAAAEALVGKNAMSGLLSIVNAAPADIDKLTAAISNCDGTSQQMADTMQDNLAGQLTILKSQLEELAISFGEMLIPIIRDVVSHIQNFTDKLNSMDEGTRKTVITIAAIVAAIGPVLIFVGKIITAVGTIMTIVPKVTAAIKAVKVAVAGLNTTLLANPITLIIAAIAALVAAFIYLWNNCEGFREFWINLWEKVKEVAVTVWNAIKDFFVNLWNGIKETASTIWNGIGDFFSGLWDGIKSTAEGAWNGIKDFFSGLWDGIKSTAETIWNGIGDFFRNLWSGLGDFFTGVWEGMRDNPVIKAVTDTIKKLWENLKNTLSGIWNGIKTIAAGAWEAIKNIILGPVLLLIDLVTGNFTQLKEDAANIWNNIKEAASTIWSGITQTVGSYVSGLVNGAITLFNGLRDTASAVWTSIQETATTVWTAISEFFTNLWTGISETASTIWNRISETASAVWTAISEFFSGIWEGIKNVFSTAFSFISSLITTTFEFWKALFTGDFETIKQIFSDAWNTISETINTVVTTISTFLSNTWETIKTTISNVMTNIGTTISTTWQNVWNGITNTVTGIYNTIVDGFNQAVSFVKGLASQAFSWGADIISNIIAGIKSMISGVVSAVSNVASTIRSYLHFSVPDKGPLVDFESWMPDFMGGLAKGIENSRSMIQKAVAAVSEDMVISPKLAAATAGGAGAKTGKTVIQHTGTIRVEGVDDEGMMTSVVELIVDKMRMEARC